MQAQLYMHVLVVPSEKDIQADSAQRRIAPFRLRYRGDEKAERERERESKDKSQGRGSREYILAPTPPDFFVFPKQHSGGPLEPHEYLEL